MLLKFAPSAICNIQLCSSGESSDILLCVILAFSVHKLHEDLLMLSTLFYILTTITSMLLAFNLDLHPRSSKALIMCLLLRLLGAEIVEFIPNNRRT